MILAAAATIAIPVTKSSFAQKFIQIATQLALCVLILTLTQIGFKNNLPSLWPLAVLACVVPFLPIPGSVRRHTGEYAVASIILTTLLTHAIFFGEDRYHLMLTPAFIILAAGFGRKS